MKCIECENYFPKNGNCPAGCTDDGDVSNPEKDIYCAEIEGEKEDE